MTSDTKGTKAQRHQELFLVEGLHRELLVEVMGADGRVLWRRGGAAGGFVATNFAGGFS